MKYLSNKPMFFDMGKKPVDAFDGLEAEPAPSNYYTTAPASLPAAPPPCEHDELTREDHHANMTTTVSCLDCGKKWSFDAADLARTRGIPKLT